MLCCNIRGMKDILDLTKNGVIPKHFKSVIQDICSNYNMLLALKLQDEEYQVIQRISSCQIKEQSYSAVNDIKPYDNTSELSYIKLATQKPTLLIYHSQLDAIVYSAMFLNQNITRIGTGQMYMATFLTLFSLSNLCYETKHSKCHSQVIKSLRTMGVLPPQQKNVKDLRGKALVYWTSLLPYEDCIKFIATVSCQFNKLKLQAKASEIIDGVIVHTMSERRNGFAKLRNYQNDDRYCKERRFVFLSTSEISTEHFRDNPPCDSVSTTSTASTTNYDGWRKSERKLRIMEDIEIAVTKLRKEADEHYVNLSWEDIYLKEKVANDAV
ncbi:MAG: hypothetical protein EXX96DRAFT_606944 [Benjaminiella poitrasii]|nr:MAG: hypothetical protein EXX96DRAFT_606944 [Benjaminiella poitrasii]